MESNTIVNPKQNLKTLKLIHLAFLIGQVIFLLVAFLKGMAGGTESDQELSSVFQIVASILAVGGLLAGIVLFKLNIGKAKNQGTLIEKLKLYQSACLIKYALLEGPCLFSIVSYILTKDIFFVGLALAIILIFLFERPTSEKIISQLELNPEEKNQILD